MRLSFVNIGMFLCFYMLGCEIDETQLSRNDTETETSPNTDSTAGDQTTDSEEEDCDYIPYDEMSDYCLAQTGCLDTDTNTLPTLGDACLMASNSSSDAWPVLEGDSPECILSVDNWGDAYFVDMLSTDFSRSDSQMRILILGGYRNGGAFLTDVRLYVSNYYCYYEPTHETTQTFRWTSTLVPFADTIQNATPVALATFGAPILSNDGDYNLWTVLCDDFCFIASTMNADAAESHRQFEKISGSEFDSSFVVNEMWVDARGIWVVGSGVMVFTEEYGWKQMLSAPAEGTLYGRSSFVGAGGRIYEYNESLNLVLPTQVLGGDDLYGVDGIAVYGENGLYIPDILNPGETFQITDAAIISLIRVMRHSVGSAFATDLFSETGQRFRIQGNTVFAGEKYSEPTIATNSNRFVQCQGNEQYTTFVLTEHYLASPRLECPLWIPD
ncbi:MAG: hypothetical protein JXX29_11235 [Deltaproteobacteria bacterium]|nr:hypothetical protein [Deltaproteobacteria bacterium]MBN2672244.1 hypothetical protein [Deltaproteobacteria bacterium]